MRRLKKIVNRILKKHCVLLLILLIGLFIGLYQLDTLPAEMWGDATAHYTLAEQVKQGKLFFDYRYGGDGPIYTYLVVFVSWFIGLSFYTLKLTSVFIYLLFIAVMYFLADSFFKRKDIANVTSYLTAVSFWSITFARQPHARMLVPLFIASTILLANKKKNVVSGILLGLGMYTQASFWATPLIYWKRYKILLLGLVITIPLVISFATGSIGFFTNQSYFGEKLATSAHLPISQIIQHIGRNISANFFSFFLRGDEGFRINVPNSPHLDLVSAIFLFLGFILLIYKSIKDKTIVYVEWILLPFLLIQIPSLLDIHNPLAQPNIGRMIGVIPFVYLSTAYSIIITVNAVKGKIKDKKLGTVLYYFILWYILLTITIANCYKYFVVYPFYLPDHNTPFAKIIAQGIDTYPPQTTVIVIGSGWGEWQQPERDAISDSTKTPHDISFLPSDIQKKKLCAAIQSSKKKTVVISSPTDKAVVAKLNKCGNIKRAYIVQRNNFNVALIVEFRM